MEEFTMEKEKFISLITEEKPEVMDYENVDLIEEGILDSLDIMRITTKMEAYFDVELDPEDIDPENFASVESMWQMLQKYKGE